MPRTLHIVESAKAAWPVTGLLRAACAEADLVAALGSRAEAPALADRFIGAPLRFAPSAWAGVRAMLRREASAFEHVHAWSMGALTAARLALPRAETALTVGSPPAGPWEVRAARWAMRPSRGQRVRVRFLSTSLRDAWAALLGNALVDAEVISATRGLDDALPSTSNAESPAPAPTTPAARRAAWGIKAGERVLIALADAPGLLDARRFVFHLGVMSIAGRRVVGVVPGSARHLERAVRFTRRHNADPGSGHARGGWRLVIDDTPPPALLPAADVCVRASDHAEWSTALAERLGLPVVRGEAPTAESTGDRIAGLSELARALG